MGRGDVPHLHAWAVRLVDQTDEFSHLLDREAEVATAPDEDKAPHGGLVVASLPRRGPRCRRQQADLLVVPNGWHRGPGAAGHQADGQTCAHAAIVGHPHVPVMQPQVLRGDGPTACGSACPSWHCAGTAGTSGPGVRFRRRLRAHHVTAPPTPARTSRPVANGANSSAHASSAELAAARAAVPAVSAATPPTRGIAQQAAHAAPMPRTAFQGLIRPSPMPGQAAHTATVGPQAT